MRSHAGLAYRPELDGIRGLAILGVLIQHAHLPSTVLAGTIGVNVFFVLSGYLITSTLLAEVRATGRIDLRRFYERRFRRLMPALVAMLIAVGVVLAFMGKLGSYPGPFAVSLFYVADVAQAIGYDLGLVGHTWSLAVEEQFYLLWPALIIVLPRRFLVPVAAAGIAVAILLQLVVVGGQNNELAMFRPDVRMDSVLMGCLIAMVPVRVPRAITLACFAGLVLLSLTFLWPYALGLSSLLGAGLVAGAASIREILSNRVLVRVGQISYGLYLWQALPSGLLDPRTLGGHDVLASAMVIAAAFALALLSERFIEMPFRRRRTGEKAGATPATVRLPERRLVGVADLASATPAAPEHRPSASPG